MRIDGGGGHTGPLKKNDKAEKKEASFKARDINKDGVLSGTETKGLKGFDGDANKEISKDEFKAGTIKARHESHDEKLKKAYEKFDVNKDGKLTGTEKKEIKKYDKDGDGNVTQEEFKAGKHDDWKAKMDKKFDEAFDKLEKNNDDVLTGTEAKKHKDWDADGDGKITKDEARKGWDTDRKEARDKEILEGAPKAEKKEKKEHHKEPVHQGRHGGPQPV